MLSRFNNQPRVDLEPEPRLEPEPKPEPDADLELDGPGQSYTIADLEADIAGMKKEFAQKELDKKHEAHTQELSDRNVRYLFYVFLLFPAIYYSFQTPIPLIILSIFIGTLFMGGSQERKNSIKRYWEAIEAKDVVIAELEEQIARMNGWQHKEKARRRYPASLVSLFEENDHYYRRTRRLEARREAEARTWHPDATGTMFEEGDRLIHEQQLAESEGRPFEPVDPAAPTEEPSSPKFTKLRELIRQARERQEKTDEELDDAQDECEMLRRKLNAARADCREAWSEQLRLVKVCGRLEGEGMLSDRDVSMN